MVFEPRKILTLGGNTADLEARVLERSNKRDSPFPLGLKATDAETLVNPVQDVSLLKGDKLAFHHLGSHEHAWVRAVELKMNEVQPDMHLQR